MTWLFSVMKSDDVRTPPPKKRTPRRSSPSVTPVAQETIHAFLNDSEQPKAKAREVTQRVRVVTREDDENIFFETQDRREKDAWVHRNYIRKQ